MFIYKALNYRDEFISKKTNMPRQSKKMSVISLPNAKTVTDKTKLILNNSNLTSSSSESDINSISLITFPYNTVSLQLPLPSPNYLIFIILI